MGQWAATGQFDIGFSVIIFDRDFTVHPSTTCALGARKQTATLNIIYYASGDMLAYRPKHNDYVPLQSGGLLFSGPIGLGSAGGIYQGTGVRHADDEAKWWNDSGVGRLAGYQAAFYRQALIRAENHGRQQGR